MGNQCFSTDQMLSKNKNIDSLHIQIQTWKDSVLPDVKHSTRSEKSQFWCSKKNLIIFDKERRVSMTNILPKPDSYNISIDVTKNIQNRQFILKPNKNILYQRINGKAHIPINSTFVLGCTQYKLVKLVQNQNYLKKQIQTLTLLEQKIRQIKSMEQIQSHTSIASYCQPQCRICMQKQESSDNPLVSPCDCSGSLQYIHLDCWMEWAFKKSQKRQNYFITHVQKEKCELCKKSLLQSQIYREAVGTILSTHSKIQVPFIILEGQCPNPKNNYVLFKFNYIVISFKNQQSFSIGRSKTQDISLSMDYSMSRKNGKISLQNNEVYLEDCNSKHGIYMKPEAQIIITAEKQQMIYRYQNSLLKFSIDKK